MWNVSPPAVVVPLAVLGVVSGGSHKTPDRAAQQRDQQSAKTNSGRWLGSGGAEHQSVLSVCLKKG